MKCCLLISIALTFLSGRSYSLETGPNWNHSVELSVTRCFKVELLNVRCEDFSIGRTEVTQELQIEGIDYKETKRFYSYGKAVDGPLCQIHLEKIERLLAGADQACVTGDDEQDIGKNETFTRWRGIATRLGTLNW